MAAPAAPAPGGLPPGWESAQDPSSDMAFLQAFSVWVFWWSFKERKVYHGQLGGGNSNMFYFHPENWGRLPIWLIFFKWVETTNQTIFTVNEPPKSWKGGWVFRWFYRISTWVFFGRSRLMFSPPGSHESISHPTLLSRWCSELPIWWDRFSNRSL